MSQSSKNFFGEILKYNFDMKCETRAQFSRYYTSYENNKRPSEDFHSKLIIDNMYVEVTLQMKYNTSIRKNCFKKTFSQFKFSSLWRAHESHDIKN